MKKYLLALIPLLVICIIAAGLLGAFNQITAGPIAENTLKAAEATRRSLFPDAASFEEAQLEDGASLDNFYTALNEQGETIGYIGQTTVQGYKPGIEVTVGIDADNKIVGVNVGGSDFSETAGLGAKAKEASFTNQFIGLSVPVKTSKNASEGDANVIDAISGATMTTSGVVSGVNSVGQYVLSLSGSGDLNKASAQGFGGPVAVTLTLDDNKAISDIVIGDEFFSETEGFGARALTDEDFRTQFIGMTPPIVYENIDALSGATFTSKAVVEAINKAYAQMTGDASALPAEEETKTAALPELTGDIYTASKQGFGGPVAVSVCFDENNAISAIKIGDDQFAETTGLGANALEDSFQAQFIGKTAPLALTDIDAIAGATITSTAVVDAINEAFAQKTGTAAPAAEEEKEETKETAPAAQEAVTEGSYTATKQGCVSPVTVTVSFDENNAITAIKIGDDQFNETPGLGAKALDDSFQAQFIGKTAPLTLTDIDTIAGATVTSQAVVDAINEAFAQKGSAAPAEEETAAAESYTATKQGCVSPVTVTVSFDENNAITAIKIGDDQFNETPGLGAKALDDSFQAQFIGKTAPLALTDIDAIAGATVTSQAVVDAINDAFAQKGTAAPAEETAAAAESYTATKQGCVGPVTVTVSFDDNNAITSIKIGDDQFNETPGLGAKALEDSFQAQFIGKTAPLTLTDIDTIAGATVTSQAVVDAINEAFAQKTAK